MAWIIALAIFIVIMVCLCCYSLGWQRGSQYNLPPVVIQAPKPEPMPVLIEMVEVLPATTGPLDILMPRITQYDNIPELKARIADLEYQLAKEHRAKTRHWATVQRLKRTAA